MIREIMLHANVANAIMLRANTISILLLNVIMLGIIKNSIHTECHYDQWHFAAFQYDLCPSA